jgi:hypothetical protein
MAPVKATQTCKLCGDTFHGLIRPYCTVACRTKAQQAAKRAATQERACAICGQPIGLHSLVCSEPCRRAHRNQKAKAAREKRGTP